MNGSFSALICRHITRKCCFAEASSSSRFPVLFFPPATCRLAGIFRLDGGSLSLSTLTKFKANPSFSYTYKLANEDRAFTGHAYPVTCSFSALNFLCFIRDSGISNQLGPGNRPLYPSECDKIC